MLGKTHFVVGIAAVMAVTQPSDITDLVMAVGVGGMGALICDIDVKTSGSRRDADKLAVISAVIVIGIFIMDYFLHTNIIAYLVRDSGYERMISGVLLFAGICAFGKEQPHRSFMHSFLALGLLSLVLRLVWQEAVIYFAVGFLSHLAIDILNKKKVRVLYPLKKGVALRLCRARGTANSIFFWAGSAVAVIELALCIQRIFYKIIL